TFMPKPVHGIAGSGMHTHVSLFRNGENAFADPDGEHGLSGAARSFIAGVLKHSAAMAAITNPTVNSYKRLTPGFEAPTNIAWSVPTRSAMIPLPARRGVGTRMELRTPDPSCNPYLTLAVILAAGLDGIENGLTPPPPVQRNIYDMSARERSRHRVRELPPTPREAMGLLQRSTVVREALGDHLYGKYVEAKTREYDEYRVRVHDWELDRYLSEY